MSAYFEKTFEPWCVSGGEAVVVPLLDHGDSMAKVASSLEHVPGIQKYINGAKADDGWYTLLIHAVGSDEVWGPNKRGDSFPLEWLNPQSKTADYGYKTYEKKAQGYVHHRNTPDLWTGRVLMAEFSDAMGRAELIVKYNIKRLREQGAPYFVDALDRGELPAVSMGCRIPFDRCSVCGNKAPNVAHYCDHVRNQRLQVLPDGRRVRMLNHKPVFHDISLVSSPADPAARVLLKIAYDDDNKSADIEKYVPAQAVGSLRRLNKRQYAVSLGTAYDPDLTISKLVGASKLGKHAGLSTLTAAGILLRPHEYAAFESLLAGGIRKAAEYLSARPSCDIYESVDSRAFSWDPRAEAVVDLGDAIAGRSAYMPCIERRFDALGAHKIAHTVPQEVLGGLSPNMESAYAGYRKTAEELLESGVAGGWVRDNPRVLVSVLGYDIPVVVNFASIDGPKEVFGDIVRGANTSNL